MRILRRLVVIVGLAALVGAVLRLRGRDGRPPTGSGWRELELPQGETGA